VPLRQASQAGILLLVVHLKWGVRGLGTSDAVAQPACGLVALQHSRSLGNDCGSGVCRDGAEEWSENSGTLRNNATLVDLGVANQALQHEDIEVACHCNYS
jgi:hypothetical protein